MTGLNTPTTTGMVGRHRADFIPVHRECNNTPAALTVTLAVPMSLEDITAVLWVAICGTGMPVCELAADPQWVHRVVCETVFAVGGFKVDDTRRDIVDIRVGHTDYPTLTELRHLVSRLYATPAAPAPRRDLVGVTR
jgi:hypothetical protein